MSKFNPTIISTETNEQGQQIGRAVLDGALAVTVDGALVWTAAQFGLDDTPAEQDDEIKFWMAM